MYQCMWITVYMASIDAAQTKPPDISRSCNNHMLFDARTRSPLSHVSCPCIKIGRVLWASMLLHRAEPPQRP
jgi:hypothetical protein